MPLFHCDKCHHEWESLNQKSCDWCGSTGHIIKEKTEFEEFVEKGVILSR